MISIYRGRAGGEFEIGAIMFSNEDGIPEKLRMQNNYWSRFKMKGSRNDERKTDRCRSRSGRPGTSDIESGPKIRESDVVVLPVSDRGLEVPVFSGENEREEDGLNNYRNKCVAYQIVKKAVPQVKEKLKMYLPVPMIKERDRLEKIHDMDASVVCELLEEGKNRVFFYDWRSFYLFNFICIFTNGF